MINERAANSNRLDAGIIIIQPKACDAQRVWQRRLHGDTIEEILSRHTPEPVMLVTVFQPLPPFEWRRIAAIREPAPI